MDDYEDEYELDGAYEEPAQSSIAAPLLRALLAAAVAFGIYALVFSDDGGDLDVAADQVTTPATAITPAVTPSLPPTVSPSATPAATATEPTEAPAGAQIGVGVSAQVIAGANTTADQFAAAVSALRDLGYDVTESGISPNPYPQTTVFATAGAEAQAEALVTSDTRFTAVGENPGNLSTDIQIHILVGEDWPIGEVAAPGATDGSTEG